MTENQNPAERDAHAGHALEAVALSRTVEEQRATISNMETESARLTERYSAHLSELRDRIASLESGRIDVNDPRVEYIWRKASRIASNAGFCSEYERIAEGLGLDPIEHSYSATANMAVTITVPVPVTGTATRRDITDGDVEAYSINSTIDRDVVAEALSDMDVRDITYAIDEYSVYQIEDVTMDDDE